MIFNDFKVADETYIRVFTGEYAQTKAEYVKEMLSSFGVESELKRYFYVDRVGYQLRITQEDYTNIYLKLIKSKQGTDYHSVKENIFENENA